MELCKRVASDWKNSVAQYLIGSMYFDGDDGVPKDETSGIHCILLSAENGWPYARARMEEIYGYDDVPNIKDHQMAIIWFNSVAKNDDNETDSIKDETFYLFGNKNFEVDFTHANKEAMKSVQCSLNKGFILPVKCLRFTYKDIPVPYFDDLRRILIWNLLTEKKSSGVVASQIGLHLIYQMGGNNVP